MDCGKGYGVTAEPAEGFFLEIKADQDSLPFLQLESREKTVNAWDVQKIAKQYRFSVSVNGVVLNGQVRVSGLPSLGEGRV